MDPELRAMIRDVDLDQLAEQFKGSEYRKLVEQHLRRVGSKLELAIGAAISACTNTERQVSEGLIDYYNQKGYEQDFWQRDCAEVLQEVYACFEERMSQTGVPADEKGKFNMFQIITMNFALQARDQRWLRKFAGIRKSLLFR